MKARLHIPQPVRLHNISELTQNARERTVDTPQQNGTETLSIHADFTADSITTVYGECVTVCVQICITYIICIYFHRKLL